MSGGLQDNLTRQQLKDAPRKLVRDLRRQYKQAADEAAGKAKEAILAASSEHPGSLRAEIAATLTTSTRLRGDGLVAEIDSRGTLMPPGKEMLPAYADAETPRYTRWRHPVYGRGAAGLAGRQLYVQRKGWTWVVQEWPSARGWFTGTLQGEANRFAEAAQKAMDDIARELNR